MHSDLVQAKHLYLCCAALPCTASTRQLTLRMFVRKATLPRVLAQSQVPPDCRSRPPSTSA